MTPKQLTIKVGTMPTRSGYKYRLILVDPIGAERQRKRYKTAWGALRCIDLWRSELGATIEESELSKIALI